MTCLLAFFLSGLLIAAPKDTNAHTTPIALTVTLTEEQDAQRMLDALEKTDARITFFLGGEGIEPEQAHRITEGGHELALTIHSREQLGGLLSRRNMAAQILTARSGLPPRVKPHWLRLEEGLTGGAYQVAKAKKSGNSGRERRYPSGRVRNGLRARGGGRGAGDGEPASGAGLPAGDGIGAGAAEPSEGAAREGV